MRVVAKSISTSQIMRIKIEIDPKLRHIVGVGSLQAEHFFSHVNLFNEEYATTFTKEMLAMEAMAQPMSIVIIDSTGGEVESLASMVSSIEASSKPVLTFCKGKAYSCGAYLLGFGSIGFRYASPNSTIMFHSMGSGAYGKPEDINVKSKAFSKLQQYWCEKLSIHCGHKDKDYFSKLLRDKGADIWMTPKEAKKHKLIDHIGIPSLEVEVTLNQKLGVIE